MMDDSPVLTGWFLPLLQAVTTGLFAGLAAWAVDRLAGWEYYPGWAVFAIVTVLMWLRYRARWERILAAIAGIDLDLAPAQPARPADYVSTETVRVEMITEGGHKGDYYDLPIDRYQSILTCRALEHGASFTYGSLAGAGKPLSRSEFETLRDYFLARGLARWKNPRSPNQGLELTAAGRAIVKKIASLTS